MKTSVISEEFRPATFRTRRSRTPSRAPLVVFDGPEDYHARIDDPSLGIDETTVLFMRGTGPIGYPGSAEVVNMQPPTAD
jgi:dihydroxy-acid dehydratase